MGVRGVRGASRRGFAGSRLAGLVALSFVPFLWFSSGDALALTGALTPIASPPGCVSETDLGGTCTDGFQLTTPGAVASSPDGKHLYVPARGSNAVSILKRNTTTGVAAQLSGPDGCVSDTGANGQCAGGTALEGPSSVAVSPDGVSVYVTSLGSDSVSVFKRKATTGTLTQLSGTAGCHAHMGLGGACTEARALDNPTSVTVSPDGANVYVASLATNAVAVFKRNTTTGALAQLEGERGCIRNPGTGPVCTLARGLIAPTSVTVSPDRKNVYVTGFGSNAVAILTRNLSNGSLFQAAGTAGCMTEDGFGGRCADGSALVGPLSVVVSPDKKSVYVASFGSNAVAAFSRNLTTGELSQLAGPAGCVSEDGSNGACADGSGLTGAFAVAATRDKKGVYVAGAIGDSVAAFSRNPTTGVLTQPAAPNGCASESGSGGECVEATALRGPVGLAAAGEKSVYVAAGLSDAIAAFSRDPATSALNQLSNPARGCVADTGLGGLCDDAVALLDPRSLVLNATASNLYAASTGSSAATVFKRNSITGILTQLNFVTGCVSEDGTGGRCMDGRGLNGISSVVVSPGGAHVYAASVDGDAIAIFKRNGTTGALTQLGGTAGCVSEDGSGGECTDGKGLDGAASVAVSPDGAHVYVASTTGNSIAVFKRKGTSGELTQLGGTSGCVSEDGSGGACADGTALLGPTSVVVGPGGTNVYVASLLSDAVAIFKRNGTTGVLSQLPGTDGCVSQTGTGGACANGIALDGPTSLVVVGQKSVYVASSISDAIAILFRNATTGKLQAQGCISEEGVGGCADARGLDGINSVTGTSDKTNVYGAATVSDAVTAFKRDLATGNLVQLPGTAGCVSETGTGGRCVDGRALDGAAAVAVTASRKSVYAGALESDAIAGFTREP